ncbi:MAG: hypothetical protein JO019_02315 [Candidatus Kaiserbacteria bacterium]|nr:hypothetical protein [Candidatus Kaiserbacteria bacterium]
MALSGNVQLIAGNQDAVPEVLALLEAEGIETTGNPDLDVRTYSQFLVEDARSLCERASGKALGTGRRVFIVVTPNLTYEAQNTMLKTLEEAPGDALFIFIVPSPSQLLPTVRSRAQIMSFDAADESAAARSFLAATPQKRLDLLKPLLEKDEADVRDIGNALSLLAALERELSKDPMNNRVGIDAVYRARKYIGDKGSLLKSLLEQVALLAPRV